MQVKTNLGHSEAASGLSSVIKATLALENGCIPATIGLKNINPKIKTEEWGVKIVTETTPWPTVSSTGSQVRRIGVVRNPHCLYQAFFLIQWKL